MQLITFGKVEINKLPLQLIDWRVFPFAIFLVQPAQQSEMVYCLMLKNLCKFTAALPEFSAARSNEK
jgi:hypothetical protein